jgi:hypothetical protein
MVPCAAFCPRFRRILDFSQLGKGKLGLLLCDNPQRFANVISTKAVIPFII